MRCERFNQFLTIDALPHNLRRHLALLLQLGSAVEACHATIDSIHMDLGAFVGQVFPIRTNDDRGLLMKQNALISANSAKILGSAVVTALLFGTVGAPSTAEARCMVSEWPCFSNPYAKKRLKYRKYKRATRRKGRVASSPQKAKYLPVLKKVKPKGLPLRLAKAVVTVESAWRPTAVGPVGEVGLMQLGHGTAKIFAPNDIRRLRGRSFRRAIMNPTTNLKIGTKYLHWCYKRAGRNVAATIGCYNRGPGRMWQWSGNPITKRYVYKVRRLMR